ncbi:hypothetical protein [Haloarcula litorea]|uniref:hypothetical protein n=1 Tax=Haloarcula litorea TaxID=3032579 RepID=UPI0023E7BBE7|nr:hypothetical protein [Halomicroarcula sp. GDY20]
MPSRRSFLAAATSGTFAALTGCSALSTGSPDDSVPDGPTLAGETVFAAADVSLPDTEADRTDDPAEATLAVYPPGTTDRVRRRLAAGTPTAVAGPDAQGTLLRACRRLDARCGFVQEGWEPDLRIAAAVPRGGRLDTHLFVGTELPGDLPWTLAETLDPPERRCVVPFRHVGRRGEHVPAGIARIRGRGPVGNLDRRDFLSYRRDDDGDPAVVVDTTATITGGAAAGADERYRADRVVLAADFDARLDDVGPGARATDEVTVRDLSDDTENAARQVFTPAAEATRRSLTACSRCRVVPDALDDGFSYVGNVRFRWRNPRFLRSDETWVHHTPGRAVWSL